MISLQKKFRKRLQDKYLNQLHLYVVILSNWTAVDDKSASASCWLKCSCNTETLKRANEMEKKIIKDSYSSTEDKTHSLLHTLQTF